MEVMIACVNQDECVRENHHTYTYEINPQEQQRVLGAHGAESMIESRGRHGEGYSDATDQLDEAVFIGRDAFEHI